MTSVVLAVPESRAAGLADELEIEGIRVVAVVSPAQLLPLPPGIDAAVVAATRGTLTHEIVTACDRAGVRLVPLGDGDARVLARYGLAASLAADATGWEVATALAADHPETTKRESSPPHRVTVVWGPAGAPGRSTVAIQLAVELTRVGRRTALVDADTVAPSLALLLGLGDEAPGIAAACRRAELGALDAEELTRLSAVLETSAGDVEVLGGINRPSRWPELAADRLRATLRVCRTWSEETVVDVSSAFDADDEATFDLAGPRRHAATMAALQEADAIVAIASADPLGISRFIREHAELRRLTDPVPVSVVVNRVRSGPLGFDARGQVRRTLERLAGITAVEFLPFDQRAADAALLHARPMADLTPRSALVSGVRRLVASRLSSPAAPSMAAPAAAPTGDSSRGSSRGARRPQPAREAQGG
ncbi:AAA family ATPase [Microbacterium foliorum]|uniref:CobQ/CobB/MinD/ParA nucleotide binding domain protein n=1 Tax=Microbacterium foliorum TaxID=104336 RepID=A0A0F0KD38_9MICO|nr:P-loop NTPase [Microbacterium foliorum]KJL18090.1 CobQ/CobB/MinD/ParA nucleotide binding domain protein [Microbacterium foliorum]